MIQFPPLTRLHVANHPDLSPVFYLRVA